MRGSLDRRRYLVLIAGPNGAGKTTCAPALLRDTFHLYEYINSDSIAQGLSGFRPESSAIAAGRIAVQRMRTLMAQRTSFAYESTLAGVSLAQVVKDARQLGYIFEIAYIWLRTPELAVTRVADRVRRGGHDIPVDTINRRYNRGLRNVLTLYKPLADHWTFYDNSGLTGPRLVACGTTDTMDLLEPGVWREATQRSGQDG